MSRVGTTILVVLVLAVFVVVCLAIDRFLRRGLDKAFDKLHNSRKRKKAASRPGGRFRLADRYSGVPGSPAAARASVKAETPQAEKKPVGEALSADEWELDEPAAEEEWEPVEEAPAGPPRPEPRPAPQTVRQTPAEDPALPKPVSSQQAVSKEEPALPVFDVPDTIPPFQEDRCCICNGELSGGRFAVLFKADSGAEARIDRECALKLTTLVNGSDPQEIAKAGRYMMSRYKAVDPKVSAYLDRYVRCAADRLKQQRSAGK